VANQADKIRSINSIGWDGLETGQGQVHPIRSDIDHQISLDIAFRKTFQTKEGKRVLDHLIAITVDQPAWVPGADTSYGFAREGQNSIIREIQQRVRRANEPNE